MDSLDLCGIEQGANGLYRKPTTPSQAVYIIAEISANDNQNFKEAIRLIHGAKELWEIMSSCRLMPLNTTTVDCSNDFFSINKDTQWEGRFLYNFYGEACALCERHAGLYPTHLKYGFGRHEAFDIQKVLLLWRKMLMAEERQIRLLRVIISLRNYVKVT